MKTTNEKIDSLQTHHCPLCRSIACFYLKDKFREYFQCSRCSLIFVPPQFFLKLEEEKAEYDLHDNQVNDLGYRGFLSRLFTPLLEILKSSKQYEPTRIQGLDFGCGPGPALKAMFEESGISMDIYDPYYAINPEVFNNQYDFITATEVFEHLHKPQAEIKRLWALLNTGGYLGIMTKLVIDCEKFSCWHYKNDKTHVIFFSKETFKFLSKQLGAEIVYFSKDVIILYKRSNDNTPV